MEQYQEFCIWDEEHIPHQIIACFGSNQLQELIQYLSNSQRYFVFYYLHNASWVIYVHDRYVDEQISMIPKVTSVVQPPTQIPRLIEAYF